MLLSFKHKAPNFVVKILLVDKGESSWVEWVIFLRSQTYIHTYIGRVISKKGGCKIPAGKTTKWKN
jgi:hypothetical protein